jgi:hypothetical protein
VKNETDATSATAKPESSTEPAAAAEAMKSDEAMVVYDAQGNRALSSWRRRRRSPRSF